MAVRDREHAVAVGDVVDGARHRSDEAERPGASRRAPRAPSRCSIDSTPRTSAATPSERRHLAGVAAQHGDVDLLEDPPRGVRAVRGRAGADGVEHDGHCRARWRHRLRASIASTQCSESVPMLSTSAPASATISSTSSARMRHHGQRAERERRVRGLVHDDVVRDLVDERLALAHRAQRRAGRDHRFSLRMSTGPSPAPISARPCSTARDAAAAAPGPRRRGSRRARAARRASPSACSPRRASPRRRGARRGSRRARAVEEVVDGGLAVTAGDDRPPARRARAAARRARGARRVDAGQRLRLGQVRRDDRREREEPPTSALDRVVLEQLRARARDHHRVDDERHRVPPRGSRRRSRSARGRRASRSSPRRRRCRRRPPRAARDELRRQLVDRRHRRACSAPSARRARRCRRRPRRRTPSGRPGCRPPPPLSEVAIVSARGNRSTRSLRRHDPDQVRRV